MGKTYVIGDIHGCHRTLVRLLGKINLDPENDCLIFLGDYIDRGPDSRQVVSEVIELRKKVKHFIALMGNHEEMLLRFLAGRDQDFYLRMGGISTLESYGIQPPYNMEALRKIPADHLWFFNELFTCWEDDSYIYVHAGLEPGVHISQQPRDWLLWARDNYLRTRFDFGKAVVSGHTPFLKPYVENNKIIIDTGAVYGGYLSCLVLPEVEFIQVEGEACWEGELRKGKS